VLNTLQLKITIKPLDSIVLGGLVYKIKSFEIMHSHEEGSFWCHDCSTGFAHPVVVCEVKVEYYSGRKCESDITYGRCCVDCADARLRFNSPPDIKEPETE